MAVKNGNNKTCVKGVDLTLGPDGRYYSDPSKVPSSVVAPTLSSPTMTSTGASVTFSGGSGYTTLIPQYSTDNANWTSISSDTSSPFTFTGLSSSTLYYFRALPDNNVSYASNTVSGTTSASGGTSPDTFPHANAIFADGFESQALYNVSGRTWTPTLNTSGGAWGGTNFTSLVTSTARVFGSAGVINDTNVTDDWTPHNGTTSLRFNFNAGADTAEQRFFIGQHVADCWIRYWIRVPTDFYHGTLNNKFLATWTNVYDGSGDVTFQTRPTSSGSCKLVVQDGGVAQPEVDVSTSFISATNDLGRWMQIAFRLKAASGSGANDGVIEVWRRWDGETSFTQLYSKTNARFYEGGQGIHEGYLMGWANNPYAVQTEWLIDNFEVGNGSMVV